MKKKKFGQDLPDFDIPDLSIDMSFFDNLDSPDIDIPDLSEYATDFSDTLDIPDLSEFFKS